MSEDTRTLFGWSVVIAGAVVLLVSALADDLGMGYPGFGSAQANGAAAGLVLLAIGGLSMVRSRGLFVAGVIATVLGAGLFLVTDRGYEAKAAITLSAAGQGADGGGVVLADVQCLLSSPRVAAQAAALAAHPRSVQFGWNAPHALDPQVLNQDVFLRERRIEFDPGRGYLEVSFRAEDPAMARLGANLLVEASRDVIEEIRTRPRCGPPSGVVGSTEQIEIVVESVHYAEIPEQRHWLLRTGVGPVLPMAALGAFLATRYWRPPHRPKDAESSDDIDSVSADG